MSIQITIPVTNLKNLRKGFGEAITEALQRAAMRIQRELVHLTPRDKYGRGLGPGRLQTSFRVRPSATGVTMKWGARHAKYPDLGVAPHRQPKAGVSKKGISTPYGVFKVVKHPGQDPQNYRFNTALAAQAIIKEELEKAVVIKFG
jgi:hypothetical protein